MKKFTEKLYETYGQQFSIDHIDYQQKTTHQDLMIFHNAHFGKVMVLDGVIQTTEKDEFIYHEMLAHVPLIAHGNPKKVLIIGGGDGGVLREVLKHPSITQVTQVEIDDHVIELSKKYLPQHSKGAFEDPRLNLVIDDGVSFLNRCQEQFDVIISDSTDPIGPGEALFTDKFYQACERRLTETGILVTQNGVAFYQLKEIENTAKQFSQIFKDWHFYSTAVPTYIGGLMMLGFATNHPELRKQTLTTLCQRFDTLNIETNYYNPEIHQASFALPQYVLKAINKQTNE